MTSECSTRYIHVDFHSALQYAINMRTVPKHFFKKYHIMQFSYLRERL